MSTNTNRSTDANLADLQVPILAVVTWLDTCNTARMPYFRKSHICQSLESEKRDILIVRGPKLLGGIRGIPPEIVFEN